MLFYYDAQGNPAFVDYVDEYGYTTGRYEYILNLQGDVVALYCPTKKTNVVTYTYDAWGKQLGFTTLDSGYAGLMYNNPLRYRGYCYDEDTGFYYLQSRYYDPTVGRFLNADDGKQIHEEMYWNGLFFGVFCYCNNNPINRKDTTGCASSSLFNSRNIVILTISEFWFECEFIKLELQKLYGRNRCNIKIKAINDVAAFKNAWNSLSTLDTLIINSHAGYAGLVLRDNVLWMNCAENLKRIRVKQLILLGCNAGHYAFATKNIASTLAKKVTGYVIASDGTVTPSISGAKFHYTSRANYTWRQTELNGPLRSKRTRNYGWILYQYKNNRIYVTRLHMYIITMTTILSGKFM